MIYKILRIIFRFLLKQYFSSINTSGVKQLDQGPVLYVVNHPNYALDAILVASVLKRPLWFLAKATIFRGAILSRLFRSCHMVPIFRRMDVADGKVDNEETFKIAAQTLSEGKGLVIFPEGVSLGERKLLPLKTGAARMVFQAEDQNNYQLGIKIQPIGLTYTDLERFRSPVTLRFGEPISVDSYLAEYQKNPPEAVKLLTQQIEEGLRSVSIEIKDESHISLVEKITQVYRTRDAEIDNQRLMQIIADNLAMLGNDNNLLTEIKSRIDEYLELSSVFLIDDSVTLESSPNSRLQLLFTPFMFIAILINFIPYYSVQLIVRRIATHPVQIASFKFTSGILFFSVWYLVLSISVAIYVGSLITGVLFLSFLILLGYMVNNYLAQYKLFLLSAVWPSKKKPLDVLRMLRDQVIKELDGYRVK